MSPPAKIRLIYFNLRGRAEISRLILAQAGAPYEDVRVTSEEWPQLKKTVPTGQLPVLEYNGEAIAQSITIARFLAREFKLAGKTSWETAKVDMIVDCLSDIRAKFRAPLVEPDEARKKELTEAFRNEEFPVFMRNMEALLVKNGGKFFVGDELTLADIFMAHTMSSYAEVAGSDWKHEYPNLDQLVQKVLNLPNIKEWMEKRPITER